MFRKMRRFRQELPEEKCLEILRKEPRGVLAVSGEDGYPYALPINYLYDEGKIFFHCAREGHKMDAILRDSRVSFCVYDSGYRTPEKRGLNISSVIVFGRLMPVGDHGKAMEKLEKLGLKYFPDDPEYIAYEIGKNGNKVRILELTIDHMTGKLVNES